MKNLSVIFKKGLIIFLGFFVCCLIFEFILQVTDHTEYNRFLNDTKSGLLTYRPNSTFRDSESCFDNIAVVNNLGFHGPNISTEKKPGIYRIVVVGSSFVEALQVPLNKMFTSILQDKLNSNNIGKKYEVIPVAFSGNKTFENILYYNRFGKELDPDMVINLVTEYEPRGEAELNLDDQGKIILSLSQSSQNPNVVMLKNLMRKSKLLMNIYNRLVLVKGTKRNFFLFSSFSNKLKVVEPTLTSTYQWSKEDKVLSAFSDQVKKNGSKFLLLSWPTLHIESSEYIGLSSNLTKIAQKNDFSYFNLEPYITSKSRMTGNSPVWSCNDHWSEYGHLYTAEALYNYLIDNPKFLRK